MSGTTKQRMSTSKISIIIPVYNVERYLERCLQSVIDQTYSNFEVICVNDGSTDNSGSILMRYAAMDQRFRIIVQENQGVSEARNNGVRHAIGRYVYFCDSDDCLHPQLLEITLYFAERDQAALVCFAYEPNDVDEKPRSRPYSTFDTLPAKTTDRPLYYCKKKADWKIFGNATSKLYHRDLIADHPFMKNNSIEDYPHTITLMAKYPKTVILKESLYYYTRNPLSVSNSACVVRSIHDYHAGLFYIYDHYMRIDAKNDLKFIIKEVFPNILKQQFNRILRSVPDQQPELWQAFREELLHLNEKGCLCLRGNKLSRYIKYRRLMSRGHI